MSARHVDGDELAVRILLGKGTAAQKQAALAASAKVFSGSVACPECGDEGPHDSQVYMGEIEFYCDRCGEQFLAPEVVA